MENIRKTYTRIGIAYSAFLFGSLLLQMEIGVLAGLLYTKGMGNIFGSAFLALVSLATYLFAGGLTYLIVKDMDRPAAPARTKPKNGLLLGAFFVSMGGLYTGNIMGQYLMALAAAITGRPMVNPVETAMEGISPWAIFAAMVVMAPIFEELLYRKVLIDRIRQYGDKTAILVSAVLFGLSHGNFFQFFYAFALGAVFAYVYIQTGKIRYTILFHSLINFMGSIVALKVMKLPMLLLPYGIFMLGSAIGGIIIFIRCKNRLVFYPGTEECRTVKKGSFVFLNPGMLLFFLASLITFVIAGIA